MLLKQFAELLPGSVLNRDQLVEGLAAIENMYKTRGYIYWFADPVYKEVGKDRVDVDIKMFEGEKFYLGRLEVKGNTLTRDKVIRREFGLDEGDVMDMEAIKKSIQKISQLGYFKLGEEPDFSVRPDGEEGRRRPEGAGDEPQRDPVRRGLLGIRRFLRAVLLPDAQLPRARRDHRRVGPGREACRNSSTCRTRFRGSWTRTSRSARRSSAATSIYSSVQETAQGRHALLREGARSLRFGLRALFVREHRRELSGGDGSQSRRASPRLRRSSSPPRARRPRSRRPTATTAATIRSTPRADFRLTGAVQVRSGRLRRHELVHQADARSDDLHPGSFAAQRRARPERRDRIPAAGRGTRRSRSSSASSSAASRACAGYSQGAVVPLHPDDQRRLHRRPRAHPRRQQVLRHQRRVPVPEHRPGEAARLRATSATTTTTRRTSRSTNIRTAFGAELRIFLPIFQAPLRFIYAINLNPVQPLDQYGFPITNLTEKKSGFTFSIGRTF